MPFKVSGFGPADGHIQFSSLYDRKTLVCSKCPKDNDQLIFSYFFFIELDLCLFNYLLLESLVIREAYAMY